MKKTAIKLLVVGALALGATAAYAAAPAQTPSNWPWTPGKDPKQRVERPSEVTTNPDGSTREVITKRGCTTIREKLADGAIKTSYQCAKPN